MDGAARMVQDESEQGISGGGFSLARPAKDCWRGVGFAVGLLAMVYLPEGFGCGGEKHAAGGLTYGSHTLRCP